MPLVHLAKSGIRSCFGNKSVILYNRPPAASLEISNMSTGSILVLYTQYKHSEISSNLQTKASSAFPRVKNLNRRHHFSASREDCYPERFINAQLFSIGLITMDLCAAFAFIAKFRAPRHLGTNYFIYNSHISEAPEGRLLTNQLLKSLCGEDSCCLHLALYSVGRSARTWRCNEADVQGWNVGIHNRTQQAAAAKGWAHCLYYYDPCVHIY